MRLKNVLSSFADFKFEDLAMNEQSFEDYKSKYLDLHDKVKGEHDKEKVSILDDVDFELELIHRDDINVAYILRLLANLKDSKQGEREKQKKAISDLLSGDIKLRSKKKLIEKFINENVLKPEDSENVEENFESFWDKEKQKAIALICEEEGVEADKLQEVIGNYIYTERTPIRDEIVAILKVKPKIRERKTIAERIISKIKDFVETFIDGIGG
jgi:type I restriction enzyme R subunit